MFDAQRKVARHLTFFFLAIAGGWSPIACSQQPNSVPEVVNKLIPELMNKHSIPGMAIAVSHNNKDYLFEFGVQDKQSKVSVSQNTLFEVGSISKLFNAALASKSHLQGKLDLERPIDNYLSYLQGTPLGKVPVFHLATHTAGGFPLQLPNHVNSSNDLKKYFQTWQPKDAMGTQRAYANPSIGLLGMLTATAHNTDYSRLLNKEVLEPIGLSNTYLDVPKSALADYAWGNSKNGKRVRLNPSLLADEAYGIKTSHKDLLQFLKANFASPNSTKLIDRALVGTHASMFDTGMFHQALIWDKYQYPLDSCKLKQGNSYQVIFQNVAVKQLNANTQGFDQYVLSKTGSTNGFGAYIFAIPTQKFALVLLANKNYSIGERVKTAYKIMAEVLGQKVTFCD